jgi:hypothetical protein
MKQKMAKAKERVVMVMVTPRTTATAETTVHV